MNFEIRIESIDHQSPYLERVIELGNQNSKTLGFMPRGGFITYAEKRLILIAISDQSECIGYLMYRISTQQVTIVHLCVDQEFRGQNIARKLINKLIKETEYLYGIKLSCRRDYNLGDMWSSFGFILCDDRPGRSKDGHLLDVWRYDHGHRDLLDILDEQEIGNKICVVIDANIFYDLAGETEERQIEDSRFLLADWLQTEVELCLTDEIDTEISRHDDGKMRERLRKFSRKFKRLPCKQEKADEIRRAIRKYFPDSMSRNDESDLWHLARTVASNAQFFVTRDTEILDKEQFIYDQYKVSILRPIDLIIHLDKLRREVEYQPVRLAGTSIKKSLVEVGKQELLIEAFLLNTKGERKSEFKQKLHEFFSKPSIYQHQILWDENENSKELLALIIYEKQNDNELNIKMLRVRRNYFLGATIIQHLILESIKLAAHEGMQFVKVSDPYLDDFTIRALIEDNFIQVKDGWLKATLAIVSTVSQLSVEISNLIENLDQEYVRYFHFRDLIKNPDSIKDSILASKIERMLYPAKIIDANIPTFIIPIQPQWAENLFDEDLANQDLFGARRELALKREVVYYRKIKNSGGIEAPGRILWYVSKGKSNYYQVQSIRACSYLDDVIKDTPKNLFRQFRRLGIYKFKDLVEAANGDLDNLIMAIKFSDTETFISPIPLKDVQSLLGKKITFQSPFRISSENFHKLYNRGMRRT